jgi:hypothetical protein
MPLTLSIAVEDSWRGSMLDTVRPVATLPLAADADVPGLLTLACEYAVTLADGSAAVVRCARTAANRHVLDIGQAGQPAVHVEADAPISALLRLRDGRLYQFAMREET